MVPPELFEVVFDGAPDGSEIIESSTSAIDFESLEVDVAAFDEIVEEFFVMLEGLSGGRGTLRVEISGSIRVCNFNNFIRDIVFNIRLYI